MHFKPCAFLVASILAVMGAAVPVTSAPVPPPDNRKLARAIFEEIIDIPSTDTRGTTPVADALAKRFAAAGFAPADMRELTPPGFPHHADLVVRLKGRTQGKPVLWIGHTDVVEAKPEDWTLPPFRLTEKGGYFYGRGTSDMKNDDAAMAAALIRLRQEHFVPARDIVVAFTANEESGDAADGMQWLTHAHRELIDAAAVINPDSGGGAMQHGRRLYLGLQTSEKTYVTFTLEVTNKGGHSSQPRPDNAIYELANGLIRLSHFDFPVALNATTRAYFTKMALLQSGHTRADMLALAGAATDARAATRLSATTEYNALLRTTCIATMLAAGHAENALPARAEATIQCRALPGDTVDGVKKALVDALADPAINVSLAEPVAAGPESPPTPEIIAAVSQVSNSMWPGLPVIPVMDAGASDSVYTRAIGMPSYGVNGAFNDIDDMRAHGRDERLPVASFYEDVEFTYRLMKKLSGAG